ncbi:hypothetical protein GCM10028777_33910 [Angustibacter speluncae]
MPPAHAAAVTTAQAPGTATRSTGTTSTGTTSDLELLTGPSAHDLLAAAVTTGGGELVRWRVRQVDHRPGRSVTASYTARVRWGAHEQDETLGASTGTFPGPAPSAPDGVLTLSDGVRDVQVWRLPLDPALPGLAAACDPVAVAAALSRFGAACAPDQVRLTMRAYRPRRGAVVQADVPGGRLFLKVLRPHRSAELHDRHRLLHGAGLPVPRSLGHTPDGVVVLEPLLGEPMRPRLLSGGPVPSGRALVDLVDRLPRAVLDLPQRRSWSHGAAHYAGVVAAALPEAGDRVRAVADAVLDAVRDVPADEPCHGDLYEGQLLLDGPRVSGLLDVDSVGPGRRADDLACLLAHAHVLGLMRPRREERLAAVRADWLAAADAVLDPAEVRVRTAGVLLSLTTGPHRVQEDGWQEATLARVAACERWLGAAG